VTLMPPQTILPWFHLPCFFINLYDPVQIQDCFSEHLNAEIVLQTIVNITDAISWLKTTFLYIRVGQTKTGNVLDHHNFPSLLKHNLKIDVSDSIF
jgi:hypothetical protein